MHASQWKKAVLFRAKCFLGIVTVFALVMMAFPYYSSIFYKKSIRNTSLIVPNNLKMVEMKIKGMTCESCEIHITKVLESNSAVIDSKVSYVEGSALVKFDSTKTSTEEIEKSINQTGYSVISKTEKNEN